MWSRDGKELFFVPAPAGFMVVTVRTEPSLTFTTPVDGASRIRGGRSLRLRAHSTCMPDGRIVGVGTPGQSQSGSGPAQIHVVLNWFEELKARAPTK